MRAGAEQFTSDIAEDPGNERQEKLRRHFEEVRGMLVLKYQQIVQGDRRLENQLLATALAGSNIGENNQRTIDTFAQLRRKIEELCEDERLLPLKNGMLLEIENIERGTSWYYEDAR